MWRAISLFILGVFCAALFNAAVSVYILHDVAVEQTGHWNEAFASLCSESILFTVIIGGGVAVLTAVGRFVFRLSGYAPRWKLVLFLGIGVSLIQYPWDFVSRAVFPKLADASLFAYLIVAIVVCSCVFVGDALRQRKLGQAYIQVE